MLEFIFMAFVCTPMPLPDTGEYDCQIIRNKFHTIQECHKHGLQLSRAGIVKVGHHYYIVRDMVCKHERSS